MIAIVIIYEFYTCSRNYIKKLLTWYKRLDMHLLGHHGLQFYIKCKIYNCSIVRILHMISFQLVNVL